MLRFIISERYIKLFSFVYDSKKPSIKDISKYTGFQYLHTIIVLKQFQIEGLIKPVFNNTDAKHKSDPGNPYIIELTPKGQAVHRLLNMLYRLHLGVDQKEIISGINNIQKNDKKEVSDGRRKAGV